MRAEDKGIEVMKSRELDVDDRKLAGEKANGPAAKNANEDSGTAVDMPEEEEEEEAMALVPKKKRSRKVVCLWCCGITGSTVIVLVVLLIVLIFTVFKVKDPTFNLTGTSLKDVSVSIPFTVIPIQITAELDLNATVHNPNAEGFKYKSTTAYVSYRGEQVAQVPVAAGDINSKSSEKLFLPVQITLSSNEINGNLTHDLITAKMLPLVSTVSITGTVKFGIISIKNIRVHSVCNINYFLVNQTETFSCQFNTKI